MTTDFAQITKQASTTFYSASLLFPKEIRNDVFILYAYVRTVDDYIDHIPPNITAFNKIKKQTKEALSEKQVDNELVVAFVDLARRKRFDTKWIWSFFDSQLLDYNTKRYKTHKQLDKFTYGVAEVIGLFMSAIMKLPKSLYPAARDLGHAMQMINILRDIHEDALRGRTYIPQKDLVKYNVDTLSPKTEQERRQYSMLIQYEISIIDTYMKRANYGISKIPKRYRVAIRSAYNIYTWYIEMFSKHPEKTLANKKIKPSRGIILLHVLKAYYQTYILNI